MKSTSTPIKNVHFLINRLGRAFTALDKLGSKDLAVVQSDVTAIRAGRGLIALQRACLRDPKRAMAK